MCVARVYHMCIQHAVEKSAWCTMYSLMLRLLCLNRVPLVALRWLGVGAYLSAAQQGRCTGRHCGTVDDEPCAAVVVGLPAPVCCWRPWGRLHHPVALLCYAYGIAAKAALLLMATTVLCQQAMPTTLLCCGTTCFGIF